MEIDIPKIWKYLGGFAAPLLCADLVSLTELCNALEPLMETREKSGLILAEVLKAVSAYDVSIVSMHLKEFLEMSLR